MIASRNDYKCRSLQIERQFQPLVQEPEDLLPATLAYLMQEADKQPLGQGRPIWDGVDALMDALLEGRYAKALTRLLWPETPLRHAMKLTLDHPEQLVNEVYGEYMSGTF